MHIQIEDKKKVDILLSALKERYDALHEIRHRVQGIGLWALGLLLGASAWLFQTEVVFHYQEKIVAVASLLVSLAIMRVYIGDLRDGYKRQQRIIVNIEQTLGFFKPGAFLENKETLYPETWQDIGTSKARGNFFKNTYAFLYVGTFILITFIILNGYF